MKARGGALETGILVAATAVVVLCGWAWLWHDPGRDFDHQHGWEHAQDGQLARMLAEEGLFRTGFAPVSYRLHDPAGGYRYNFHYPVLPHALLSIVFRIVPEGWEHAVLRLAGMCATAGFLLGLFLLARELGGTRNAAWALLLAGASAEVLFYGAFPSMYVQAHLYTVFSWWAYLRWRGTRRRGWALLSGILLLGVLGTWYFFYGAVLPIAADLLFGLPGASRRHRVAGLAILALPAVVFAAIQLHYRYGVPLGTGREAWGGDFRESFPARARFGLWGTAGFWRDLFTGALWAVSPPAVIGLLVYWIGRGPRVFQALRAGRGEGAWKGTFLLSSAVLAACLPAFPKSTLDHEFLFFALLIPASLAGAACIAPLRSPVWKAALAACAVGTALSTGAVWASRDNTPRWEYRLGLLLRLATPDGALVRVPLSGEPFYAMLLFYSHRELLFDVPARFRYAGPPPRFEVAYGADPPAGTAALDPGEGRAQGAILLDREPGRRPPLPAAARAWEGGAWEIARAGVTASRGSLRLVEVEWVAHRPTAQALAIEIGQYLEGGWVGLGTWNLQGNHRTTRDLAPGSSAREGWLVGLRGRGPLILRVFDRDVWQYRNADTGRRDLYLE